ncbi:MAG: M23 family metallopeptidase [Chloroflexi bacterium]|nr:MAG: M23 family metallopeptidase [Chloroflexota bacterium]
MIHREEVSNAFLSAHRKIAVLVLLLFSACSPIPPVSTGTIPISLEVVPTDVVSTGAIMPLQTSQPGFEQALQPTSVVVSDSGIKLEEVVIPVAPTPAADPLRISFPDAKLEPVSALRPPLYPTPWALSPYDHFYFARPIAADEVNWPLWDYRYGGSVFEGVIHTGIDITAPKGTPILAAGAGDVIWAGYGLYYGYYKEDDPYGLAVAIHHDFGYDGNELYTVYGHLDQVDVARGQHVEVGQIVGLSGATGNVTGPHLHFEVRSGKSSFFTTYNPELWLVPPEGWGVLVGRVMNSNGALDPLRDVVAKSLSTGQRWLAKSYGSEAVNSDPYYQENLVISDLPSGRYELQIAYFGRRYTQEIYIYPGTVTYFSFMGRLGFDLQPPEVEINTP